MTAHFTNLPFDNSYERDLKDFYVHWKGENFSAPQVLRLNSEVASELGLNADELHADKGANMLTGATLPDNAASLAMAYAGHQFGHFSQQLGDGRALLVGELIDQDGNRRDLQLKGSGRTPFSRGGDGKAVLGPMLREYLIGEAMHSFGIPTTRALAVSLTGEQVMREKPEPGAVLARVASSHLRVGTFQFFAARGEGEKVKILADYAIARHYPDIAKCEDKYLEFFRRVRDAQASLVAKWVLVGFVHGVMNTDNMTISGETIDYGPCAFIDTYKPDAVFSSVDEQGRYAYGSQPTIAQWNLARLAETLVDLVNPNDREDAVRQLTNELNAFPAHYQQEWLSGVRAKLGLMVHDDSDLDLANDFHSLMEKQGADFTKSFRALADGALGNEDDFRAQFLDVPDDLDAWLKRYEARLSKEDTPVKVRTEAMNRNNPVYIPRNHIVEEALAAANTGDLGPFDKLVDVVTKPFTVHDGMEHYAEPAPEGFGPYRTFCGT